MMNNKGDIDFRGLDHKSLGIYSAPTKKEATAFTMRFKMKIFTVAPTANRFCKFYTVIKHTDESHHYFLKRTGDIYKMKVGFW